jgi:hypothetical protein
MSKPRIWIKSSFSADTANCVEISWAASSKCSVGDCVQVRREQDLVYVRDSKLGDNSPVLRFTGVAWWVLTDAIVTAKDYMAVRHRSIAYEPDGHVLLSTSVQSPQLRFDADEWKAFVYGCRAGEFDPDRLTERFQSSSSRRGVAEEDWAGVVTREAAPSQIAATGAGVPASPPAPVAAHEPLADAASTPGAAQADGPGWRPSPATGAGEAGAASSRPAPVAAPTLGWISVAAIDAVEAVALELCAAWPIEIGSDLVFADQVARIAAKAVWPFAYQAGWSDHGEWAKRAAPLVPAVETQETVS